MWTELQFVKFQNILTSASWFRAWTPALEFQTKNAIEIMYWFQRTTRLPGWQEKTPMKGKTKTYLDNPSLRLKRTVFREQENVFLSEFGPIVPTVLFGTVCEDIVYLPGEKLSLFTHFCSEKIFLMYMMENILAKLKISKKVRNTESFI